MTIKYPLTFQGSVQSPSGIQSAFEAKAGDYPPIVCDIPIGFNGPGGGYSPEDLYLLAVASCFIATFKVFAEKAGLGYTEIKATSKLTVERSAKGVPELQKVELAFTLTGVEDQEKAKTLLAESEKFCLVANAIKSEKSFTYNFA